MGDDTEDDTSRAVKVLLNSDSANDNCMSEKGAQALQDKVAELDDVLRLSLGAGPPVNVGPMTV